MRTLSKSLWVLILLASVLWMIGGAFLTSDAYRGGEVGSEVAAGIASLASDANVSVPASVPPPLLFVLTGLPLAGISLLLLRRNRNSAAASAAQASSPNLRRQTIIVTVLALIVALLIWNIQDVERALRRSGLPGVDVVDDLTMSVVGYPVRLFVTFVHEAGHSLAALLSGGQVLGFTVSPDGSGLAATQGGNPALVIPAGYLGAALFGSSLFFLTNRIPEWTRGLAFLLGLAIVVLTLSYARPDAAGHATALVIGIGFGIAMIALGLQAPRIVNVFLLNTLAILTGLNAVFDLWYVVRNPGAGDEGIVNDAAAFSQEVTPLLPTAVIAFMWAAIAVAMCAFAVYVGLIKQVTGELAEAVNGKAK